MSPYLPSPCEPDGWSGGSKLYRADARRKKETATMADVMIYYMGQSGLQGRAQGHATECERGMARRGPASVVSLTLRDLLTASPFELMRRFTEGMDRFFEGRSWSTSVMTLWSPSIAI